MKEGDMKITDVRAMHLALPHIARRSDGTQDALIVVVDTDAGITGGRRGRLLAARREGGHRGADVEQHHLGPARGGPRLDPLETRADLARHVPGVALRRAARLFIHAMSGIDLALWDIFGKATGLPVHTLLGGAFRRRVRAYASTLFGDSVAATADRARWCVDQGFTAVKFGWDPLGEDRRLRRALVAGIRDAVGPDVDVLIDAGQCWDLKHGPEMVERLRALRPLLARGAAAARRRRGLRASSRGPSPCASPPARPRANGTRTCT
jgi:L-rhamnonate dehydratase